MSQPSVSNSQPSFYDGDNSDSMSGDTNYNPEDGDDMDMGDVEPTIPSLTKASSKPDAEDVLIFLWKPSQYNNLGCGKSEFIIGGVTIHVMSLSKADVAYFPCGSKPQTLTSRVILYGNMQFIIWE